MKKFIVFVLGIMMSVTCLLGLAACKDDYTFKIEYVLDTETSEVLYGDPGEKVLTNADAPITLRVSVYNERKNEYVKSPKMKWNVSNSKIAKIGKTKIVKNTQAPMQAVDIQVKSAGICTLTAKYAFAKKNFTLEVSEEGVRSIALTNPEFLKTLKLGQEIDVSTLGLRVLPIGSDYRDLTYSVYTGFDDNGNEIESNSYLTPIYKTDEDGNEYVSSLRVMGVGTGYLRIASSAYEGIYADYPFLADFSSEPIKAEILSTLEKLNFGDQIYKDTNGGENSENGVNGNGSSGELQTDYYLDDPFGGSSSNTDENDSASGGENGDYYDPSLGGLPSGLPENLGGVSLSLPYDIPSDILCSVTEFNLGSSGDPIELNGLSDIGALSALKELTLNRLKGCGSFDLSLLNQLTSVTIASCTFDKNAELYFNNGGIIEFNVTDCSMKAVKLENTRSLEYFLFKNNDCREFSIVNATLDGGESYYNGVLDLSENRNMKSLTLDTVMGAAKNGAQELTRVILPDTVNMDKIYYRQMPALNRLFQTKSGGYEGNVKEVVLDSCEGLSKNLSSLQYWSDGVSLKNMDAIADTIFSGRAFNNQNSSLTVEDCGLTMLDLSGSQLTSYKAVGVTAINGLYIGYSAPQTESYVRLPRTMVSVVIDGQEIEKIRITDAPTLSALRVLGGNVLTEVHVQYAAFTEENSFVVDRLPASESWELTLENCAISSMNSISIADASTLKKLDLSGNQLTEFDTSKFGSLLTLDLSHNAVSDVKTADGPLVELDISYNELQSIGGLEELSSLQTLNLRNNKLQNLQGIHKFELLYTLDIRYNAFLDASDCDLAPLRRVFHGLGYLLIGSDNFSVKAQEEFEKTLTLENGATENGKNDRLKELTLVAPVEYANKFGASDEFLNPNVDVLRNFTKLSKLTINDRSVVTDMGKTPILDFSAPNAPRYSHLVVGDFIEEVTLVGDGVSVFNDFYIQVETRSTGLTIYLKDFLFKAPDGMNAIDLAACSGVVKLNIDGVVKAYGGENSTAKDFEDANGLYANDLELELCDNARFEIYGGDGAAATTYGGDGVEGGAAMIVKNFAFESGDGAKLTLTAGNGGNGYKGSVGSSGTSYYGAAATGNDGWNGGRGGNGGDGGNGGAAGYALLCLNSFSGDVETVDGTRSVKGLEIVAAKDGNGGDGGQGGNGGRGGNGGQGAAAVGSSSNGGNGGRGGDGGNGGNGGDTERYARNVYIASDTTLYENSANNGGNGGAVGLGGYGGSGGSGGSGWFWGADGHNGPSGDSGNKGGLSGKSIVIVGVEAYFGL